MNNLIILNHEPDIPPFMSCEMQCASKCFDKVWYVNTKKPINSYLFDGDNKYTICYPSKNQRRWAAFKATFDFFSYRSIKQVFQFMKEQGVKKPYFRGLAKHFASDRCIRPFAQKIVDEVGAENCVVLSTWFGACAVTAARLKKNFPKLKAYSLAHSYDILVSRSPYIPYYFVDFKHTYLDGVYFISDTMRQLYIDGVGPFNDAYIQKMHVSHLGSIKEDDDLNAPDSECFNICTCSRMIPLKRLDVMCEALRYWTMNRVTWTHIGSGETELRVRQLAEDVTRHNPLVNIRFLGHKTNAQVKDFYRHTPIDVFCNLSSIEGVPVSIMEAISYGIPVIATDVGGTKEIVTPETGILIDSNITGEKLRIILEDFAKKPKTEKDVLRISAFNFWREHFNAMINSNKLFAKFLKDCP